MSWTDISSLPYTCSTTGGHYRLTGDLSCNSGAAAITVSAANVVIDGQNHTVTQTLQAIGIYINADNTEVYDTTLTGRDDYSSDPKSASKGIYIYGKDGCNIHDCTLTKWYDGVIFSSNGSSNFTVSDCNISYTFSHSIKAFNCDTFTFSNLTVSYSNYGVTSQNGVNYTVQDCTASHISIYAFICDGGGNTFTWKNCNCTTSTGAFFTDTAPYTFTVRDCTFDGCTGTTAVSIDNANDFTLLHCTVTNSANFGVIIKNSSSNFTLYGNTLTNNTNYADSFQNCSGFDIYYTTLSGNGNSNNHYFNACSDYTVDDSAEPAIATPTFDPVAGEYSSTQNVTVSCTQSTATIYYTTDGSTPDSGDTQYSAPISVSTSQTIKAIALETNYPDSSVASAGYTINLTIASALITAGYWFG
jgi:parallel beta-helix repeat protein